MLGEHRVHDDEADAQVGAGQGRARIEAEPAERQDERAEHDHRDVVPGHRLRLAVRSYLPMRGPMTIAPASAMTPPIACTTPEPAKSTAPWPSPQFMPPCASQPPPQTQFA